METLWYSKINKEHARTAYMSNNGFSKITIIDGTHLRNDLLEYEYFQMPNEFIIPATRDSDTNIRTFIHFVYEDINLTYNSPNYFSDRVIMAPICAVVISINNKIMNDLPVESSVYRSIDSIEDV